MVWWVKKKPEPEFELIPFVPNDPPVSGYDRDYCRTGVAWRHKCGKLGSMGYQAILLGWQPFCLDCKIGPHDKMESDSA